MQVGVDRACSYRSRMRLTSPVPCVGPVTRKLSSLEMRTKSASTGFRVRSMSAATSRTTGMVCSGSGSHSERNDLPFPLLEEHDALDRVHLVLRSPIAEPEAALLLPGDDVELDEAPDPTARSAP